MVSERLRVKGPRQSKDHSINTWLLQNRRRLPLRMGRPRLRIAVLLSHPTQQSVNAPDYGYKPGRGSVAS